MTTQNTPMKEEKRFQIYIGFGGAGCKSIVEMTSVLKDDFVLGTMADRKLAFLFIDTDQEEIDKAIVAVEENLRDFYDKNSSSIVLHRLDLGSPWANGRDSFQERIITRFHNLSKKSAGGAEDIRESWWTHENGEPFCFNGVKNPSQGASQMPLSSRIMAWENSAEIKKTIDGIVDESIRRNVGCSQCDLYFVTSLAGGTGRGCWSTLAFMMREQFERRSVTASPIGIYLDATTFPDLPQNQHTRVKLNSLTGMSELTMWLQNARRRTSEDPKQDYVLYNLDNPEKSAAVIDTMRAGSVRSNSDSELAQKLSRGTHTGDPVDLACIITGVNEQGVSLVSKDKYQKQVGQILYSLLKYSDLARREFNNTGTARPLFSLGSTIYAVESDSIRDYMRIKAKECILSKQIRLDYDPKKEKDRLRQAWTSLVTGNVGDQGEAIGRFDFQTYVDRRIADAVGSDLLLRNLNECISPKATGAKQNSEKAESEAARIDGFNLPNAADLLRAWLKDWYTSLATQQPEGAARPGAGSSDEKSDSFLKKGVIKALFEPAWSSDREKAKLSSIQDSIEALTYAEEYFKSLKGTIDSAILGREWVSTGDYEFITRLPFSESKPGEMKALIKSTKGKAGVLGAIGMGSAPNFDPSEQKLINSTAIKILRSKYARAIYTQLSLACQNCLDEIPQVKVTEEKLLRIMKTSLTDLKKQLEGIEKKAFLEIKADNYAGFSLLNPKDKFDTDYRYNMRIKSPLTLKLREQMDVAVNEKLSEGNNLAAKAMGGLSSVFYECALRETSTAGLLEASDSDAFANFYGQVTKQVGEATRYAEVDDKYIAKEFNLGRVLERYVQVGKEAYQKLDPGSRTTLKNTFLDLLGVKLEEDSGQPIEAEDLVAALASYAAENSAAWINVSDQSVPRTTYLCVPRGNSDDKVLKNKIKCSRGTVDVVVKADNPYMIVSTACVAFPAWDGYYKNANDVNFGGVRSLDYWRDDPILLGLLKAAEETKLGKNVAVGGCDLDDLIAEGGVGYLDPRFLQPAWSRARWSPWRDPKDRVAQGFDGTARAFVYLTLFGNFATPAENSTVEDAQDKQTVESVLAALKITKWEMPVLKREKSKWKWNRAIYVPSDMAPHFIAADKKKYDWKVGADLENLHKLYEALNGFTPHCARLIEDEIVMFQKQLEQVELTSSKVNAIRRAARKLYLELADETDRFEGAKKQALDAFLAIERLDYTLISILNYKP